MDRLPGGARSALRAADRGADRAGADPFRRMRDRRRLRHRRHHLAARRRRRGSRVGPGDRHLGAAARGRAPARHAGRPRQRAPRSRRCPDPPVRARMLRPRGVALWRDVLRRSGRRLRQPGARAATARPPGVRLLGAARGQSLVRAAAPGRHREAGAARAETSARSRPARAQRAGLRRRDPERRRLRRRRGSIRSAPRCRAPAARGKKPSSRAR